MNPILARELRARFRDRRSFWLVFGLAALLCLAAGWIYQDALHNAQQMEAYLSGYTSAPFSFSTATASATGRRLFIALSYGNVLTWMLVAPALTATGLCKERERGLLESLWLTPFRVRSQILGRFLAALLFLFELQLIATPVYGIVLMLGGVSPQEILAAGAIIGSAAFSGAALGLWCSARAYRPSGAMGSALGTMIIGTLGAFYFFQIFDGLFYYLGWTWVIQVTGYMSLAHPFYLLTTMIQQNSYGSAFIGSDPNAILIYGLGGQLLVSLLLLAFATRKAAKPLAEAAWLGRNPYLEGFRRRLEKRQTERQERKEKARMGEKVGGALLYEVPFEKLVRFRDPLLRREVRARFRMRQSGAGIAIFRFAALFVVVLTWLFMIASLFDPDQNSHADIGEALLMLLTVLGIATAGILSSSTLTGERESGTLESLKLSLLGSRHIVISKWLSPLITFACWSSLLWIWLPLCLQFGRHQGLLLLPFLAAVSTVVVAVGVAGAWGLFISSRAPHTAAATSWTVATLIFFLLGVPVLDDMLNITPKITQMVWGAQWDYDGYGPRDRQFEMILNAYHPFITIDNELQRPSNNYGNQNSENDGNEISEKFLAWFFNVTEGAAVTALLLTLTIQRAKKTET